MDELERQHLSRVKAKIRNIPERWARLSPRERDFLRLRVGLDDERFRDLAAIAQLYGVTVARIRSIEVKALRKLGESDNPGPGGAAAGVPRKPRSPQDIGTTAQKPNEKN